MGRKTAPKGEVVAPVVPAKPLKKGKREAEEVIEKEVSKKKQKKDVEEVIEKEVTKKKQKKDVAAKEATVKKVKVKTEKKKIVKKQESSDDSSSSESEEEQKVVNEKVAGAPNNGSVSAPKKKEESSEKSSSEEDSDSSDEGVTAAKKAPAAAVKNVTAKNKDTGVEAKAKTPLTPQPQTLGSKTLLVEGLSYNTKKADVENFFKECGEVVDVGIATWPDGAPKGCAHVEFATVEALQKAKEEKNGKDLMGRAVRLEIANKRWTWDASLNKENLTICVEGFNKEVEGNKMKDALRKHFSSCGEFTKIAVRRLKGYAYIEFKSKDAVERALKFDLSELNTYPLKVKEAQPRDDRVVQPRDDRVVRFEGKKTIFGDD